MAIQAFGCLLHMRLCHDIAANSNATDSLGHSFRTVCNGNWLSLEGMERATREVGEPFHNTSGRTLPILACSDLLGALRLLELRGLSTMSQGLLQRTNIRLVAVPTFQVEFAEQILKRK